MRLIYKYILLVFFILIIPNLSAKPNFNNQYKYNLVNNDTIDASKFGVKADFDGVSGTDNRKNLQNAIDYASINNKKLLLPKGKILLNSYGEKEEDIAHGNIIQLKSNLFIIGNNSEFIIGSHFDDKGFIVFSGFNSPWVENFTTLKNITLKDFKIDFQSKISFMRTKYSLRKGIEFGHTTNISIENLTFKNGDLTCAIATGYGSKNISSNLSIKNSYFINLVKSETNIDHSTLYINSTNSNIENNIFKNDNTRSKLMACAIEFHNSNNKFENNKIEGYTRMMYIVAIQTENKEIKDILIQNNIAKITNAAIYLWLDYKTYFENIYIFSNNITSSHVKGYSMLYNGTQGIIADSREEKETKILNMIIKNNKIKINKTVIKGRAVKFNTKYNFIDKNNTCIGCIDGDYFK